MNTQHIIKGLLEFSKVLLKKVITDGYFIILNGRFGNKLTYPEYC